MDDFNANFNADDVLNEFKSQFKWPSKDDYEAVVKPSNRPVKLLVSLLITAVIGAIAFYVMLPAINIHSTEFYTFAILLVVIFMVVYTVCCGIFKHPQYKEYCKAKSKIPLILIAVIIGVAVIGSIAGSTIIRSRSYNKLLTVEKADFNEDFKEISFSDVPRLDATSTKTLADNKLNELSQYVSQFLVADTTTQINYQGKPIRVAPLVYGDFFKWLNNTKNGLPAYMIIDMVTQEVTVVELEEGMRYSPTELFNRKLERHLRFQYPTELMGTSSFEIDENGRPYWITPALTKKIGLFGGTDVKGAIITDAATGKSKYYEISKVPTWVDKVYYDDLIVEQYNYYGRFQKGFINSLIGQKDVKVTSRGNGYIALNDDVWLYTGITSASSDASNVGFILSNQRTKETRYYEIGGATELGAMESAQGAVQDFGYSASFPILLNVSGEPTYFMSLKDSSQIVKQYAMVNLKRRTICAIGTSPQKCAENYIDALVSNDVLTDKEPAPGEEVKNPTITGAIEEIRSNVKEGNTYYYVKVAGKFYSISASECENAVIMNVGDTVTIEYKQTPHEPAIIPAKEITFG